MNDAGFILRRDNNIFIKKNFAANSVQVYFNNIYNIHFQAQEVWEPFPSVLFGSFALLSGLLIFTVPETWRKKLPDTFEEAEALSRR